MSWQILFLVSGLLSAVSGVVTADVFSRMPDPTRPDGGEVATVSKSNGKPSSLILTSTLLSPAQRSAIINGKRVQEGQTIAGAKVLSIRSHSVVVARNGRKEELRFQVPPEKTGNKK